MLLFGFAFRAEGRSLRTLFVLKQDSPFAADVQEFAQTIGPAIIYEGIIPDRNVALDKLARNEVDMVIIVPDNPLEIIRNNQQAMLEMYHNEIDPIQVDYVRQVGRLYVDALNRKVLSSVTQENQQEAGTLQQKLEAAQASAKAYREALAARNTAAAASEKQNLNTNLVALRILAGASLGIAEGTNSTFGGGTTDPNQSSNTLSNLDSIINGLNAVPDPTTEDEMARQEQDAAEIEKNISDLNAQLSDFEKMDPNVITSPFNVKAESVDRDRSGAYRLFHTGRDRSSAAAFVCHVCRHVDRGRSGAQVHSSCSRLLRSLLSKFSLAKLSASSPLAW